MKIFTIVGRSGTGKTTLLENLIRELSSRGYNVGALKHHAHKELEFDKKGKDTHRLNKAGAIVSALTSPSGVAMVRMVENEWSPKKVSEELMNDLDLVLCEGFTKSDLKRLIIVEGEEDIDIFSRDAPIIGLITIQEEERDYSHRTFSRDNLDKIADFLEEKL